LNACTNHHEIWYVYHTTWGHLSGVLHKSLTLVIPALQLQKLFEVLTLVLLECLNRSSWNFVYNMMPPEAMSMAYFINHSHQ
jgi:hypothetical protein